MKLKFKTFLMTILFILSLGLSAKEFVVEVPAMVCQMCVYGMKKHFKSAVNDPEKDIMVDLEKKTVHVILKTDITEENIKQRVTDAGYEAGKITWIDTAKK